MIKTYRISNMDAIINSVKGPSTNEAPKATAKATAKTATEVKEEIREEIQLEEKEEIKQEPEAEPEPVEEAPVVKKTTRKKSTAL